MEAAGQGVGEDAQLRPGVVLTPHIVRPLADRAASEELSHLLRGVYNTGFVGLSRRTDLDALFDWWQARLYRFCLDDPGRGLFVDQRWLDLIPGLFPNVYVWRDLRCNIARWNYAERPVEHRDGRFVVGAGPLRFMHYSGFRIDDPEVPAKDPGVVALPSVTPPIAALLRDYRARLIENGYESVRSLSYAYGRFDNGIPIPNIVRACYREVDAEGERWPDPFATGPGSFFEFLNSSYRPEGGGRAGPLTQLAAHIYRTDRSLQQYLPRGLDRRPAGVAAWVASEGAQRYHLGEAFVAPLVPRTRLAAILAQVRQQREIEGLAWRARLRHVARALGGDERLRRWLGRPRPGGGRQGT